MHVEYTELMSLVLDGEATAQQVTALHTHTAVCSACAQTWGQWQALDTQLSAAPLLSPAPGLTDRVLARLEERRHRRFWPGWLGAGLFVTWIAIAFTVLLMLLGGIWWGVTHPLQASVVLSASTHLLSGFIWLVRGVETGLTGTGLSLWVGLGVCATGVVLLASLWVWLVSHRLSAANVLAVDVPS